MSLRQKIRRQRQALNPQQLQTAAENVTVQALQLTELSQAQHIAVYLAHDNEIDLKLLINEFWQIGKTCYLPVLAAKGRIMQFARYRPKSSMQTNKYGILEPVNEPAITTDKLDLVFMPLVAVDKNGNRLGMGGGYYDATFAFLKNSAAKKPRLIGCAYEFQLVERVNEVQNWDVSITTTITCRC